MKNTESGLPAKTPMERLADFTKKLISVPKKEIDKSARDHDANKRGRQSKTRVSRTR